MSSSSRESPFLPWRARSQCRIVSRQVLSTTSTSGRGNLEHEVSIVAGTSDRVGLGPDFSDTEAVKLDTASFGAYGLAIDRSG